MISTLFLALAIAAPDPAPFSTAVQRCDRDWMVEQAKAEPARRATFALGVYNEQRAIAEARAALDGGSPIPSGPAGAASLAAARDAIDARQRRLDDAVKVERAWRDLNDEFRAEYLSSCTGRKKADA